MDRFLGWILGPLASLLAACYSLVNSYAAAIALFTMVIMVVFTPLTMKSTRSMMAMQLIQPEMKALQAKYRDDRQTLNTEMMALYQSHGVNPLGGCLPLLVQMPVFFALFALLRGLTRFNEAGTQFDPNYVGEQSQLFKDLSTAGGEMMSLGIDLARQANDVVSDNLVTSIPYVLLVVVTGITSWFQQRQMAARRMPGQEIPQQQMILMKVLPWTLPVFSFFMPAGLVVYFIVSNLWRVGQQAYIGKRIHGPAAAEAAKLVIETDTTDDTKSNGKTPKSARTKPSGSKPSGPRPSRAKPGPSKGGGSSKPDSASSKRSTNTPASSSRPRPRSRQGNRSNGRSTQIPDRPASRGKSGQDRPAKGRSARQRRGKPAPRGPAPTSRTAGHGPNRSNKKKKR